MNNIFKNRVITFTSHFPTKTSSDDPSKLHIFAFELHHNSACT